MNPSQLLHVRMYVCLIENTIGSNHIQQPYTYIIIYHKHYPLGTWEKAKPVNTGSLSHINVVWTLKQPHIFLRPRMWCSCSIDVVLWMFRWQFVEAYIGYLFNQSVDPAFLAFSHGFLKVCGGQVLVSTQHDCVMCNDDYQEFVVNLCHQEFLW